MNALQKAAALLCLILFTAGFLTWGSYQQQVGHILFLAGAIIFAGLLISSAITESGRRD
ncbi:MAG TPA: hypothetical protein VEY09_13660 [Pyrinomonadaceae bacterium]|nr:hypothetical protein [Pyrinomonadaceae bacterium]